MLATATRDPACVPLTDQQILEFTRGLKAGERFVITFEERLPDNSMALREWDGQVVEHIIDGSGSTIETAVKYAQISRTLRFRLPPGTSNVAVLDLRPSPINDSPIPNGSMMMTETASNASMTPITRENSSAPSEVVYPSDAPGMMHSALLGPDIQPPVLSLAGKRLWGDRNELVMVSQTCPGGQVACASYLLKIVHFTKGLEALEYIKKHPDTVLSVATSSLQYDFDTGNGMSGPELVTRLVELRGDNKLPLIMYSAPVPSQMNADVIIIANDREDELLIGRHELTRRLMPPIVVYVDAHISDEVRHCVSELAQIGFSVVLFDNTNDAYKFILRNISHIGAVVTSTFQEKELQGNLSGLEVGRRVKQMRAANRKPPFVVIVSESITRSDIKGVADAVLDHVCANTLVDLLQSIVKKDVELPPRSLVFAKQALVKLANHYPCNIEPIPGKGVFPSVEHFFQAAKHYDNPELFEAIRTAPSVHSAVNLAWSQRIHERQWMARRDAVMRLALAAKFSYPAYGMFAQTSEGIDLIHHFSHGVDVDYYWSDGRDGSGKNMLGIMLMEIRERILRGEPLDYPNPFTITAHDSPVAPRPHRNGKHHALFRVFHDVCIGEGAFGRVFKAIDNYSGAIVAVKETPVTLSSCLKSSFAEFDLMSQLINEHIVQVLHCEVDSATMRIFMEWMPNGSLENLVSKGRLYEPVIRAYIQHVLEGLEYLHSQGVVHCDVKPANILLSEKGAKLADFGISKLVSGAMGSRSFEGTPQYMSPERLEHGSVAPADDVWAIGCTIVRMASGGSRQPWCDADGVMLKPIQIAYQVTRTPHHPAIPAVLSPAARAFALRCFAKEPKQRPSARDLLNDPWFFQDPIVGVEDLEHFHADVPRCREYDDILASTPATLSTGYTNAATSEADSV